MLALMLPALAIVKVVKIAVKRMGPAPARAAAGISAATPRKQFSNIWYWPLLGLIVFGFGAFMYWRGAAAGPLTAMKAKDLEEGKKPASSYLKVEGVPVWKETIAFKRTVVEAYVPVVSRDWKQDAVAVYVQVSEDDLSRPTEQVEEKTFTGMTAVGGLPGPVRVSFEQSKFKPAAGYVVIETKEEPAKLKGFGKWPMIVGAALVVGGLAVWGVKRMLSGRG